MLASAHVHTCAQYADTFNVLQQEKDPNNTLLFFAGALNGGRIVYAKELKVCKGVPCVCQSSRMLAFPHFFARTFYLQALAEMPRALVRLSPDRTVRGTPPSQYQALLTPQQYYNTVSVHGSCRKEVQHVCTELQAQG